MLKKTLANINKPYNNAKLKNRLHDYIKENNIKPLSETNSEIDLGNGKFDKIATQKNECLLGISLYKFAIDK